METEGGGVSEVRNLVDSVEDNHQTRKRVESDSEKSSRSRRRCHLSESGKKTIIGIVIVICLAVSWVGAQQFAQRAVRLHSFDAPYFATWFSTCWMVLCYPGYLIFAALSEWNREELMECIKSSTHLFGSGRVTAAQFFTIIWTLNCLWLVVNYLYIFGLKFIFATDASAIMASNVAFVYVFSLFVLSEKLYAIRIVASALCIGGVVLFGYAEGFNKDERNTLIGVIMIIASALGAAVYKVVFKKVVGNATLGQVSLYLTVLGVSNILIMWTVSVVLCVAKVENFAASDIPWQPLILSAMLSLVFNFLVNFGIAYTYPLFISIAMMMGIPLNAGIDVIIHHGTFSALRLVAAFLVFTGFAIMLFPDSWNDPIHLLIGCKSRDPERKGGEDLGSGKTVTDSLLPGDSPGDPPLGCNKVESSNKENISA